MAELTQGERLQPSLLDRLTDNEPAKQEESRAQRVLSMRKLREGVIRDILWLLNTTRLDATTDLSAYPEVETSVVNYGAPELAGVTSSSVDAAQFERRVRDALWAFEPRIKRSTVKVRANIARDTMGPNTLSFEIEGQLWAQPMPTRLFLKTQLDLEDGTVSIMDASGRGGG